VLYSSPVSELLSGTYTRSDNQYSFSSGLEAERKYQAVCEKFPTFPLGNGTTNGHWYPVAVNMGGALSGENVAAVAAGGYHTVALSSDGKVFAWGYNSHGQLGNGTTASRVVPVMVNMSGALLGKTVTAISAGNYHTVALATTPTPTPTLTPTFSTRSP
jgi:alpha-tubulin suppressor-like RCC1 family protein